MIKLIKNENKQFIKNFTKVFLVIFILTLGIMNGINLFANVYKNEEINVLVLSPSTEDNTIKITNTKMISLLNNNKIATTIKYFKTVNQLVSLIKSSNKNGSFSQ